MICDLNKSLEEHVTYLDEIDENLRHARQELVKNLIDRLQSREQEWDRTFRDILSRSQEEPIVSSSQGRQFNSTQSPKDSGLSFAELLPPIDEGDSRDTRSSRSGSSQGDTCVNNAKELNKLPPKNELAPKIVPIDKVTQHRRANKEFNDPSFSNYHALREFVRVQEVLNHNRTLFINFKDNPTHKIYKNELNLFIKTQINAISNSDSQHLNTKIRLLSDLFNGHPVQFQGRTIDVNKHPEARPFCLDLTAQTFVTVGTRLVNSVPAIARSMATVINGIVNNNNPIFRDLVTGHLQERCPFIIPMYPDPDDLPEEKDRAIKHCIACGYMYDPKTNTLESEDKYQTRMRSIVLIYACILTQDLIDRSWSWLVSFLSLYPEPVITAIILQAYLQEASKKLSSTYGRHYSKLLAFIKNRYVTMIEDVSSKTTDRQSLIKLKNLLSDESNLIAQAPVGSIFGSIKFA